jgi:hypothetical protein
MHKKVLVLTLLVAMLAPAGFASTAATPASGPAAQSTQRVNPVPPMQTGAMGSTGRPTIHWDRFYDTNGKPLPNDPQDNVGSDSVYFKTYYSLTALLGSPKSEIPNPTPESCRPAFAWQHSQTSVGMDPAGIYCYEVYNTTLRRHSTNDGSYTDFTIAHGYWACGTDGDYIYAPVADTVFKYTLTGTLLSATTLDITPTW